VQSEWIGLVVLTCGFVGVCVNVLSNRNLQRDPCRLELRQAGSAVLSFLRMLGVFFWFVYAYTSGHGFGGLDNSYFGHGKGSSTLSYIWENHVARTKISHSFFIMKKRIADRAGFAQ
jgi:hypothetical protein